MVFAEAELRLSATIDPAELYRRYGADVYRFALYLCGNAAEAEDIASETFVRVFTAAARVDAATVKGYLFTIARNLFLQARRRAPHEALDDEAWHDPGPGPEAIAEGRDELRAVLAALGALAEDERAALLMRAFHELPYEEIAATLGTSVTAAKVKVHRARLKLARRRAGARAGDGERR